MAPKSAKGKAPPPPPPKAKAKAKPESKQKENNATPRIQRADSVEVVQQWRQHFQKGSVRNLDWTALESITYIRGGSGGVILARFAGPSAKLCCIKPQRFDATAELYASLLAKSLKVPTAHLHVVEQTDEIVKALRQASLAIEEHRVHLEKKLLAGSRFLGIIEFVNGPIMEGSEFLETLKGRSQLSIQKFWEEVGQLVAFDCLINNYDRLPMIWDNAGNPKNLMVEVDPETDIMKVTGIDQAVRAITSEDGLHAYCQRLRRLVQVVLGPDESTEWLEGPFRKIDSALREEFQGCLTVDSLHLQHGLRQAFEHISQSWQSGSLKRDLVGCQVRVADVFAGVEPETVGLDKLSNFQRLVEATASLVAEEWQLHRMQVIPKNVLDKFQRLFPDGNIPQHQLANLLRLLEPSATTQEIDRVLGAGLDDTENVDWAKFLCWLYT